MTVSVVLVPVDESKALELHEVSWDTDHASFSETICTLLSQRDYLETPLVRPQGNVAGLYAYYNVPSNKYVGGLQNIRATRLSMACGLFSLRFWGDVLLVRSFGGQWENLTIGQIYGACVLSPDLRPGMQESLRMQQSQNTTTEPISTPEWLANAAQQNYHDGAALAKVVSAMQVHEVDDDGDSESEDDDGDGDDDDSQKANNDSIDCCEQKAESDKSAESDPIRSMAPTNEFVAKSPLCLHCRRPCADLCPSCKGCYFCVSPRTCQSDGWSHECQCSSWKLYALDHRKQLSTFDGFGKDSWPTRLVERAFQISEEPYEAFLSELGIDANTMSWWRTEMGGWSGGESSSASTVDATLRRSYMQGFAPIRDIPPECRITKEDLDRSGLGRRNELGLLILSSWKEYYKLRNIPESSPMALLATFPMTIYYAIERYGSVPVTVARMMNRPLRIHVVGAEKEMNFLDLFKEVGFLLPEDLKVEMVFVVRQDMLPVKCQNSISQSSTKTETRGQFSLRIEMTSNLTIGVVSGTYGDALDPNFDVGTGPPDMVVALNAGLYAYESWRSVVTYLYNHSGVVGVFSDYNEYSGVNCASLGGGKSRNSLHMNPFRQPRAMPVFSMNLPQFSNGFLYVYNEQELD